LQVQLVLPVAKRVAQVGDPTVDQAEALQELFLERAHVGPQPLDLSAQLEVKFEHLETGRPLPRRRSRR
jgi:hypothetical protein